MTTPPPIEILRVAGSHREAGRQVGEHWAEHMRRAVDFSGDLPSGRDMAAQLALAARYRDFTRDAMPWAVEEIDGMAVGSGVDPLELFAVVIEEIWPSSSTPPEGPIGRCSDLVALGPATTNGHVLVAHNNDLYAESEEELLAVEWAVDGEPLVLSFGGPPWLSAGFNEAGLSFTGNELTPNDERMGIPRQIQFRAMLREPTLEAAVGTALRHDRASSYNNVLADGERCVNVEGSATSAELVETGADGRLAHTNHYACPSMREREGDPAYAVRSGVRLDRAMAMLEAAAPASIDANGLRAMLSDHENAPDSLCRHPEGRSRVKTVFWCIADVTERRVTFGRGNPCDSQAQTYAFSA